MLAVQEQRLNAEVLQPIDRWLATLKDLEVCSPCAVVPLGGTRRRHPSSADPAPVLACPRVRTASAPDGGGRRLEPSRQSLCCLPGWCIRDPILASPSSMPDAPAAARLTRSHTAQLRQAATAQAKLKTLDNHRLDFDTARRMHNRADLDRVRQQQKHDTVDEGTVSALQEKESDLNGAFLL